MAALRHPPPRHLPLLVLPAAPPRRARHVRLPPPPKSPSPPLRDRKSGPRACARWASPQSRPFSIFHPRSKSASYGCRGLSLVVVRLLAPPALPRLRPPRGRLRLQSCE